ncbi:hypothetical protein EVAR_40597_1 [Eumeta japonica]|uniref:Uncharacterized protein n=1 Tax=Eumeta variegata TaxID=151549 RepID=A0A4C1XIR0_EUMVA|nr:hypothetical protein EVAR_40597_1 [Eumeta japonica]
MSLATEPPPLLRRWTHLLSCKPGTKENNLSTGLSPSLITLRDNDSPVGILPYGIILGAVDKNLKRRGSHIPTSVRRREQIRGRKASDRYIQAERTEGKSPITD